MKKVFSQPPYSFAKIFENVSIKCISFLCQIAFDGIVYSINQKMEKSEKEGRKKVGF